MAITLFLQSDGLHDALQGGLHRIRVGQLGGRIAVAVAVIDRFVMGQNAEQLQPVLFDLFLDAVIQFAAGCPVDDQTHLAGIQVHFFDHFGNSCHRLDAPAGAVGDQQHGIHMGQGSPGYMLQTRFVVQDPGNVGTMVRTADAAGFGGVVLGKGSVDLYNSKVLRSMQGSHFHLPIYQGDLNEWFDLFFQHGHPVYGTELNEEAVSYREIEPLSVYGLVMLNGENLNISKPYRKETRSKIKQYQKANMSDGSI